MRILLAPLWVRAVCSGLLGAAIALSASAFYGSSHRPIAVDWPTGTVVFSVLTLGVGALATWRTQVARRPYTAQVEGLSRAQRSAAIRATTRGPAPEDPEVLKAALRLGQVYLDQHKTNRRRDQVLTAILMALAIFLLVVAAYEGDAWGLVYPIVVLIVIPLTRWWVEAVTQRTERQTKMLTQARRASRKKRV
jgi:prepilin signal peptidase PulO-like enzyme (type II secretory pathway)